MSSAREDVPPLPPLKLRDDLPVIFVILVATLVIHFGSAYFYFLYEDDFFTIGIPATQTLHWVWEQIGRAWVAWPQGRPGLFTGFALEGGLINATGSVLAGYIPPLLILSANGYLTYRLLRHRLPDGAAFVGAIYALLGCADPHKVLLTHAPLQFAILLNLLGLILYLNDHPFWAFLVAGSSLFIYEISFALFLSAELIYQLQGKFRWKRLALAMSAWFGMAAADFFIRLARGESRVVEATSSIPEVCQRVLTNIFWGPLYGLANSYVHPVQEVVRKPECWPLLVTGVAVGGVAVAAIWMFRRPRSSISEGNEINPWTALGAFLVLAVFPYAMQLKRTVFPGFMRPVSGYHLCLDLALGVGVAVVLEKCLPHRRLGRAVGALLVVLVAASTYQNLLVKYDYARATRFQAHFWSEVNRLASDAVPGDIILVPRRQLLETEYILCNSWSITHGWEILFEQTGPLKDWFNVPTVRPVTVFQVPVDWERDVSLESDGYYLHFDGYTPPGFRTGLVPLLHGHFIILDANYGAPFSRRTEPVKVADGVIKPKAVPPGGPVALNRTILAKFLFDH